MARKITFRFIERIIKGYYFQDIFKYLLGHTWTTLYYIIWLCNTYSLQYFCQIYALSLTNYLSTKFQYHCIDYYNARKDSNCLDLSPSWRSLKCPKLNNQLQESLPNKLWNIRFREKSTKFIPMFQQFRLLREF